MATKTPTATASASDRRKADTATDADPVTVSVRLGPFSNAELAAFSDDEALNQLEHAARVRSALDGQIVQLGGEIQRRQAFRERGATSLAAYLAGRCGFSAASARALAHVGERLFDLPHLQHALSSGELSFDQVRAVVGAAEPESDAEWAEVARGRSVADLVDLAQRKAAQDDEADKEHEADEKVNTGPSRRSVRFNDACCTMTARLPRADYIWVRGAVDARIKLLGSDGESPLDERAGDALMTLLNDALRPAGKADDAGQPGTARQAGQPGRPAHWFSAGQAPVVVAHIALETLLDAEVSGGALAELERAGLVSAEVVRCLACDASLVVGLDDAAGHTMYEGRALRFPTETQRRELWRRDRHCRFPGCSHDRFTRVHHVVPWKPDGRTDLDNLAVLCEHHHHEVHSKRWSVSGDANVELTFVGPGGRSMTSRPSLLWGNIGTAAKAGPGGTVDCQEGHLGSAERRAARESDYEPPP